MWRGTRELLRTRVGDLQRVKERRRKLIKSKRVLKRREGEIVNEEIGEEERDRGRGCIKKKKEKYEVKGEG